MINHIRIILKICVITYSVKYTLAQLASPVVVREGSTASFRWQIPGTERFNFISVISPSGSYVLQANAANQNNPGPDYTTRVTYTGDLSVRNMAFDISDVLRSDAGTYTCGQDGISDIISNCGQKLIVPGQPTKPVLGSQSSTPVFGSQVTFTCSSTSTTVPTDHGLTLTYTWQRDNTDISVTSPGSPYTFTVTSRDTHGYKCRATESQGLESNWSDVYNLTPDYSPHNLSLQPSTLSYTKTEGQESVPSITCTASCRPGCSYTWYKGGTVYSNGATLNLGLADRSQTGSYQCRATNTHGTSSSSNVSVNIRYRPDVSLNTKPGSSCRPYRVYEDQQNVQLECQVVEANPVVTLFTWTHNGSVILSTTSSVYSLSLVSRFSGGNYTCAGSNSAGASDISILIVDVQFHPSISVPVSTNIVENQTLTVTCSVDSNPPASVRWTRKDDSSFTPQTGSTLTISNIQRSQTGTYVCTATNTLSPCTDAAPPSTPGVGEVTVDVQYGAIIKNLTINSVSSTVTVDEGDIVTLICQVDSNPNSTITLLYGSQQLTRNDNSLIAVHRYDVGCRQRGNYYCDASNNIGVTVNNVIRLSVQCSPRLDEIYPSMFSYTSQLGGDVTVSVILLAYPAPTYTWRNSDNIMQDFNSSITMVSDISMNITIHLNNLQQQDFGNYTLTVDNGVRELAVFSITIDRQGDPPEMPGNVSVTPGGSSSLLVTWKQEYNGGDKQRFIIEYSRDKHVWITDGTYDEQTNDEFRFHIIRNLDPATTYYVRVIARNRFGDSSNIIVNGLTEKCTKVLQSQATETNIGAIVGAIVGSLLAIIIIIVAVLVVLMRKGFRCVLLKPDSEVTKKRPETVSAEVLHDPVISSTGPPSTYTTPSHYSVLQLEDGDRQTYTELKQYVNIGLQGEKGDTQGTSHQTGRGHTYENAISQTAQPYENVETL